jgi:hypothetical protein
VTQPASLRCALPSLRDQLVNQPVKFTATRYNKTKEGRAKNRRVDFRIMARRK